MMSLNRKRFGVLLVDDEPLAIQRLKQLLSNFSGFDFAGEATTAKEASYIIEHGNPDIVLLDIELPDQSGLEVCRSLQELSADPIAFIFVTAYLEHAVRAFDLGVVDYIVKPVEEKRLYVALDRAVEHLASSADATRIWQSQTGSDHPIRRFTVRNSDGFQVVNADQVHLIEADAKFSILCTSRGKYRIRVGIGDLESSLDPQQFVRVHRSYLVNLDYVLGIEKLFHGDHSIVLPNKDRAILSRRFKKRFRDRFSGDF